MNGENSEGLQSVEDEQRGPANEEENHYSHHHPDQLTGGGGRGGQIMTSGDACLHLAAEERRKPEKCPIQCLINAGR